MNNPNTGTNTVNPGSAPWGALSGEYRLRPGCQPGIVGQRPALAQGRLGRLLRGQGSDQLGRTLGSVFTLCAHAHRGTAQLAWAAAQGGCDAFPSADSAVLLWLETARDHLRNIALDWPQRVPQLTPATPNTDWLRDCPLSLANGRPGTDAAAARDTLARLRAWLELRILQQSATQWLASCREPDALALWCNEQAQRLLPARCLATWYPLADTFSPQGCLLDLLDSQPARQRQQLLELAGNLVEEADFVQRPSWLGQPAETGPWSRLRQRRQDVPARHTAWTRLSARWLELVEIAVADPNPALQAVQPLLAAGALYLGDGRALAWTEMARGLLLHWLQLDAQGRVQDYRVVAPTEWNFHPAGALSMAVTALPIGATVAAQTLAAAYDPCVACVVETGDAQ